MKTPKMLAGVSERALIARINRKLRDDDEVLRRCRETTRDYNRLGDFFIVDVRQNCVVNAHVDLEALARELRCMHAWERLAP
jgi:hypothetical protein